MLINKKQFELIKVFCFIFALVFIAMNWNMVSWMFSYREVSGLAYDFFNPYPDSELLVPVSNIQLPQAQRVQVAINANTQQSNLNVSSNKTYPYSEKNNSLEIPAIGVQTSLIIGESTEISALERDLDKGVVFYPGSVLPGQSGQIVVLGHSAPPNWPRIKHDWVFSDVQKLNSGDEIKMYFNNRQYIYKVLETKIIQKGQEVTGDGLNGTNNILTLISCWPPGKDYQRIAVYAELQ